MTEIKKININELKLCEKVIRCGFQTVADEFGITQENNPSNGAFITTDKLHTEYERGILGRLYGIQYKVTNISKWH